MVCKFCGQEIAEGQRRYYSRQAGMKGDYHWECFVNACRQANRIGQQELETIAVSSGAFDNYGNFESSDD